MQQALVAAVKWYLASLWQRHRSQRHSQLLRQRARHDLRRSLPFQHTLLRLIVASWHLQPHCTTACLPLTMQDRLRWRVQRTCIKLRALLRLRSAAAILQQNVRWTQLPASLSKSCLRFQACPAVHAPPASCPLGVIRVQALMECWLRVPFSALAAIDWFACT